MFSTERGYLPTGRGLPDTGYSDSKSFLFWSRDFKKGIYTINLACPLVELNFTFPAVLDDFGNLVRLA